MFIKYVSWTNILVVWIIAAGQYYLLNAVYSETKAVLVASLMGLLAAWLGADIVGRFLSERRKERWKSDDKNDK